MVEVWHGTFHSEKQSDVYLFSTPLNSNEPSLSSSLPQQLLNWLPLKLFSPSCSTSKPGKVGGKLYHGVERFLEYVNGWSTSLGPSWCFGSLCFAEHCYFCSSWVPGVSRAEPDVVPAYSLGEIGVWILQLAVWWGKSSLGWVFERAGQGRAVRGAHAVWNVELQVSPTSACLLAPVSRPELAPQIVHLYLLETAIMKKSFCEQHPKALQSLTAHQVLVLGNHISNVGR